MIWAIGPAPGKEDLPRLHAFTRGLDLDRDAVNAAVTTVFHNGDTEGVNTKIKLLKRQMYGRASLSCYGTGPSGVLTGGQSVAIAAFGGPPEGGGWVVLDDAGGHEQAGVDGGVVDELPLQGFLTSLGVQADQRRHVVAVDAGRGLDHEGCGPGN